RPRATAVGWNRWVSPNTNQGIAAVPRRQSVQYEPSSRPFEWPDALNVLSLEPDKTRCRNRSDQEEQCSIHKCAEREWVTPRLQQHSGQTQYIEDAGDHG